MFIYALINDMILWFNKKIMVDQKFNDGFM